MKKIVVMIIVLALIVAYIIALDTAKKNEEPIKVVFDAMQFVVDDERSITESELIAILGEPESVEEWNYKTTELGRDMEYPIRSLFYDDNNYEYMFNNDHLQRINIYKETTFADKDDILPMFGLKKYRNTKVKDTGYSYRVSNIDIHDLWLYGVDENTVEGVKISYGDLFD